MNMIKKIGLLSIHKLIVFFIALINCIFLNLNIYAEEKKFSGWQQGETEHFRFIFEDESEDVAHKFALYGDSIWESISSVYGKVQDKTDVIITARTDTINATAEALSFKINLFTNPPLSPEFGYRENWEKMFLTHELTHIANFKFNKNKFDFSKVFGSAWNFFDFISFPMWYLEGLTTVFETELTTGGRGRSPFFELYLKAPTLENSFLSFNEIGLEKRPPMGQAYVAGYLIMRSIVDRWGISALAQIEKNHSLSFNISKSIKKVTGYTPEVIFNDAKIELVKKYANERQINEGEKITPHSTNSYYYKPAFVNRDGSFISIRKTKTTDATAVLFDPQSQKETPLFKGDFSGQTSLTSSDDGKIIASLKKTYYDKIPGYQVRSDLYLWTKDDGLELLTSGQNLFEPNLSRDGSRLVAVELYRTNYRIVEISLKDGSKKVLLSSESQSFIQPNLSSDGSKIAFLAISGSRAKLCVANLLSSEPSQISENQIQVIFNNDSSIIDIAYPYWMRDGSLSFASNERGRLEVWAFSENDFLVSPTPVVSDPVGAFWAEKTDNAVYYASYAATGNVIKQKSLDSWGDVPDFYGPSLPGEIITFVQKEEIEKLNSDIVSNITFIPQTTKTQLKNTKKFINTPILLMGMPLFSLFNYTNWDSGNEIIGGIGLMGVWEGTPLQLGHNSYFFMSNLMWYPQINQLTGSFLSDFGIGIVDVKIFTEHSIDKIEKSPGMSDSFAIRTSFAIPCVDWDFYKDSFNIAAIFGFDFKTTRKANYVYSIAENLPFLPSLSFISGLDGFGVKTIKGDLSFGFSSFLNALVSYFPTINAWNRQAFVSGEFDIHGSVSFGAIRFATGLKSRWFDLPSLAPVPATNISLKGASLSCEFPGRAIFDAQIGFSGKLNYSLFVEKLVSFGVNSRDFKTPRFDNKLNIYIDPVWYSGLEASIFMRRSKMAFGCVYGFSNCDRFEQDMFSLYFTMKFDALR